MTTNELKKGDRVILKCGWRAVIKDNLKGNIRLAEVFGDYTEIGSVYSHDIVAKIDESGNWIEKIELTDKQRKCQELNEAVGF